MLQAIGGIYELEKNNENNERNNYDGQSLDVYGSWIQAVGSVISAIDQTQKDEREQLIQRGLYLLTKIFNGGFELFLW